MARLVLSLVAIVALLGVGFEASAGSKKCPKGYYYDASTGKCVMRRGSG